MPQDNICTRSKVREKSVAWMLAIFAVKTSRKCFKFVIFLCTKSNVHKLAHIHYINIYTKCFQIVCSQYSAIYVSILVCFCFFVWFFLSYFVSSESDIKRFNIRNSFSSFGSKRILQMYTHFIWKRAFCVTSFSRSHAHFLWLFHGKSRTQSWGNPYAIIYVYHSSTYLHNQQNWLHMWFSSQRIQYSNWHNGILHILFYIYITIFSWTANFITHSISTYIHYAILLILISLGRYHHASRIRRLHHQPENWHDSWCDPDIQSRLFHISPPVVAIYVCFFFPFLLTEAFIPSTRWHSDVISKRLLLFASCLCFFFCFKHFFLHSSCIFYSSHKMYIDAYKINVPDACHANDIFRFS